MGLEIGRRFEIGQAERAASGVGDSLEEIAGGIHKVHVAVQHLPRILRMREHCAQLNGVLAVEI